MRVFAALGACTLAACAADSSYMGISLHTAGATEADAALRDLAVRARAGDKRAQLELGIAFEEGRGVPPDLRKAERLYRIAATDSGGKLWVYSPPVGNGTTGRVIPVDTGPEQAGLQEAARRLALVRETRRERTE